MLMITLLNFIYKGDKLIKANYGTHDISEDVMPIINELDNKGYKITVIKI